MSELLPEGNFANGIMGKMDEIIAKEDYSRMNTVFMKSVLVFISLNLVVKIIVFELTIPNLVSVSIFNEIRK